MITFRISVPHKTSARTYNTIKVNNTQIVLVR